MLIALCPSGLRRGVGSSFSFSGRGVGKALPDPLLLVGDHRGGGLADRQPPAEPVGFDVVVDQYGAAVFVAGQAVQRQIEDVLGAAAGVDAELGGDPDLDRFEGVEVGAQDGHDLRWQVTAGLAAFGIGGDIAALDGEVPGQPGRGPARVGSAPGRGSRPSTSRTSRQMHVAAVAADLAGRLPGRPAG